MKCAQQDIAVGGTAGKDVPQHHAHALWTTHLLLFPADHGQHAAAGGSHPPDLARNQEKDLADAVVGGDRPANRPVMLLEICGRDALKNGGTGGSPGSAIGCPNTVNIPIMEGIIILIFTNEPATGFYSRTGTDLRLRVAR